MARSARLSVVAGALLFALAGTARADHDAGHHPEAGAQPAGSAAAATPAGAQGGAAEDGHSHAASAADPAHEDHSHHGEQLGTVRFATSCAAAAVPHFDRGMALLHSFGYEEARRSFEEAAAADPKCAMPHWGVAMTYYHPIWAPPTAAELSSTRTPVWRPAGICVPAST